jgi:uncharacterized protein (DUF1330 family)
MKTTVALAMVVSFALGAVAVQGLHAQAKPPTYYISEIDVTNPEGYLKEYAPRQGALIRESGGRYLVAGGKTTSFDGDAPKSRVVITAWDNIDKIQAWRSSAAYKELRQIGDKYAKFRSFAVEGTSN